MQGQIDYAVILASGSNNQFYNNVLYSNSKGIQVAYGGVNSQIYNNTIVGNQYHAIEIYDSASGTLVKNNLIYNNGSQITDYGVTGTQYATNLCGSSGTGCGVVGTPVFVNAGADNYQLQAGSPGVNQGTLLVGVTTDLLGVTRPQGSAYDIGAYER